MVRSTVEGLELGKRDPLGPVPKGSGDIYPEETVGLNMSTGWITWGRRLVQLAPGSFRVGAGELFCARAAVLRFELTPPFRVIARI